MKRVTFLINCSVVGICVSIFSLAGAKAEEAPQNTAQSKFQNCGGTYTNKPCRLPVDGAPAVTFSPSGSPEQALGRVAESKVDLLGAKSESRTVLHELTMKSIKAQREHDVRIDLAAVERACAGESPDIESCRNEAAAAEKRLDERILQSVAIEEQQKANKLQEEANALQRERNEIEENKPNVVIIERRHPYVPSPYPLPPNPVPHNYIGNPGSRSPDSSSSGSYGGSISVGNPNQSIGVSVGHGSLEPGRKKPPADSLPSK